jgi:hypothetical protein
MPVGPFRDSRTSSRSVRGPFAALSGAGLLVGVAIFALPLVSPAQTPNPWSGTWDTEFGRMTLTQSGSSVEGTYTYDDGHLTGTVSGNVLNGRWDEAPTRTGPDDAGPLQFTLSSDGRSFTGTWRYDGDDPSVVRLWNGTATGAPPPPVLGKAVNVKELSGQVLVSVPGGAARASQTAPGLEGRSFVPLTGASQVPVGSFLDTRKGKMRLTSAVNNAGKTQSGSFARGVFQVRQARTGKDRGVTELRLKGSRFSGCAAGAGSEGAAAARKRLSSRTVRQLQGKANGRFRTRGRHSAATVRGTVWITSDRCDGTLTKVKRGTVAVRDFRRRTTIVVRRGKSYLAEAG